MFSFLYHGIASNIDQVIDESTDFGKAHGIIPVLVAVRWQLKPLLFPP
jgi:hypothetical protein